MENLSIQRNRFSFLIGVEDRIRRHRQGHAGLRLIQDKPWARYEERVKEFLEQISKLPNDYENVEDILNEAVEVADLYGRLQPDKFREIWEKLNKRLRESKI